MTELERYIETYFGLVRTDELDAISALFRPIKLKKGDCLLKAGRRCDQLSFVQEGMLRMFTLTDGKEVTQWISTKGYFATDLSSFIHESASRWTIQALVDTEAFSISKADYQRIGETVPRWDKLEKLFLIKCFTTLEERIFSHLSMTAEERFVPGAPAVYRLCTRHDPRNAQQNQKQATSVSS